MSRGRVLDLAWMAGIIDGEGCIYAGFQKRLPDRFDRFIASRVTLSMCHKPTVLRVRELAGMGVVKKHARGGVRNPKHRIAWTWFLHGQEAASFVRLIRPYLVTKAKEADLFLELLEEGRGKQRRPLTARLLARRRNLVRKIKALKHREYVR